MSKEHEHHHLKAAEHHAEEAGKHSANQHTAAAVAAE
jgi:hypothetical protein